MIYEFVNLRKLFSYKVMTKRIFLISVLYLLAIAIQAVPAKRGILQMLKLKDGTEVQAQLCGDERFHWWTTTDGRRYIADGDNYKEVDGLTLNRMAVRRRSAAFRQSATRKRPMYQSRVSGKLNSYLGKKKGLVILVEFKDTKFNPAHDCTKFDDILNTEGYTTDEGFVGSVADYFKAQSNDLFELNFDVVGPVQLKYDVEYYGGNDNEGQDKNAEAMIVEACLGVDDQVNFNDYDWDNDGEVEEVFVVYAGKGEADGGDATTIWPHMYELSYSHNDLTLDGAHINTYACANELSGGGSIDGIGTFCHEFSHCLGYPDFYDTLNSETYGMAYYDLMDAGCYNGDGFIPCGYSAYEKWLAGWIELTELSNENVTVDALKPMSEGGSGYVIYNDGRPDEFYILENRQQTNWDSALYGRGLMITHVDYDEMLWYLNCPNSLIDESSEYVTKYRYPTNDHMRLTIMHADNDDDYETYNGLTNDLYPYLQNDSLTSTSIPAATFYNATKQGDNLMHGAILNITQNDDNTMSFYYRAPIIETGISELHIDNPSSNVIYDLQGRRLSPNSRQKGFFIINGKKIIR